MDMNETHECSSMELPTPVSAVLILAYLMVGIASLFGNAFVILVVVLRRQMRSVTNIFISSVSAADLVITSFSLWATPFAYYKQSWIFGQGMCYVVQAIQGASLMWAPFTLAAIAVDRYLLVLSPYRPQMSTSTCILVIVGIWSGAFLVLTPMLEHLMYMEVDDCHKFCIEFWKPHQVLRLGYGICVLTVRSAVPLAIISFCHWRIATILHAHHEKLMQQRSSTEASLSADIKRKQRLQKLLLAMVLIFAISSFPLDIRNVLVDFELAYDANRKPEERLNLMSDEARHTLFYLSHWIAMAGTLLNPVVYAWWNDSFRAQIKSLFFGRRDGFRTVVISKGPHTQTLIEKNTTVQEKPHPGDVQL